MIKALMVDRTEEGHTAEVRSLATDDLPDGEIRVAVRYSSLNYKDGLAVTGRGKVIRGELPFVPGIDLVGTVEATDDGAVSEGDVVIQTGWGLGEHRWGGYAQQQRLEARALVALPEGLAPRHAMVAGTAGFTAMLSVMALEDHGVDPEQGEVVVTGASGGVGSFAVAILAALGYEVVASTGSEAAHDYLRELGAGRLIPRDELGSGPARPLDTATWAGAVDSVGGATLAALLSQTDRHGCVAACGLAGGATFEATVFPFILRGITLAGIDSNTCPPARRQQAWERLAELPDGVYETIQADVIGLDQVPAYSHRILDGDIRGRVVVDVNA